LVPLAMLFDPNWTKCKPANAALVHKTLDAPACAGKFTRHGDNEAADLMVATSMDYMNAARRLH